MFTPSHWLKGLAVSVHLIHGHSHAHLLLSVLFLLSLYFVLKFFFHLFLIPAMVPDDVSMKDLLCNSARGGWSAWTMSHPTQVTSPRTWSSQTPMSSTSRPPAISTSRTSSKIQSLSPTPTSTTTSSPSFLQIVVDRTGQPVLERRCNQRSVSL